MKFSLDKDSKYSITLPVCEHIARCVQNKEIWKFTVFRFYKMTTVDGDTRSAKEEYFIKKFEAFLIQMKAIITDNNNN